MPTPQGTVHLLDAEPGLAARLREDDRAEARNRLVLRTTVIPPGEWSLKDEARGAHPLGLMVLDGLLLQEVDVGGRRSLQLLGPGDVVLPGSLSPGALRAGLRWTAPAPTKVAVLDDRLQTPFALWPGLALGFLDRAALQLGRGAMHAAIAQLPRVEDRLEATFWGLAERWGRVTPTGIHVPLQLTHEALGQLVGGRRPTITLALAALAERRILERISGNGWMLIADAPSVAAGRAVSAPSLVTRIAPPPPPQRMADPALGEALLATVRRVAADHRDAATRTLADRRRFEETRLRSRILRETAEQARVDAGSRRLSIRPAGPSAG